MKPFPYQMTGARFLAARRRGGLLDGCRVGKTLQAVLACDMIGAGRILVVCPGMARAGWERTFNAGSIMGRPVQVITSAKDKIIDAPDAIVIVSVDGTRNGHLLRALRSYQWDVLIIDEQHFLKTPTSARTKQVLSRHGLAAVADRIWFLTATPMTKDPTDMWTMLRTVGATQLDFEGFLNRFCNWKMGDYGPRVFSAKNTEELREMIYRHFIRRVWDDVKHEVTDTPTPDPTFSEWSLDTDASGQDEVMAALKAMEHDGKLIGAIN